MKGLLWFGCFVLSAAVLAVACDSPVGCPVGSKPDAHGVCVADEDTGTGGDRDIPISGNNTGGGSGDTTDGDTGTDANTETDGDTDTTETTDGDTDTDGGSVNYGNLT